MQLRFEAANSPSLAGDVKARLIKLAGRKVSADGVMIITANRFRSQESNRGDAIDRSYELIRKASERPKTRHKTRPTKASREERLRGKTKRSEVKTLQTQVIREWQIEQ